MDKNVKQLIADNIYNFTGFRVIRDWGKLYDMNKFFKDNGIHFKKGDVAIEVEQNGKLIAKGIRRWSQRRVCLEYKELKPQIEWYV